LYRTRKGVGRGRERERERERGGENECGAGVGESGKRRERGVEHLPSSLPSLPPLFSLTFARRDLIVRVADQDLGQRGLAGPVGAHDGVGL